MGRGRKSGPLVRNPGGKITLKFKKPIDSLVFFWIEEQGDKEKTRSESIAWLIEKDVARYGVINYGKFLPEEIDFKIAPYLMKMIKAYVTKEDLTISNKKIEMKELEISNLKKMLDEEKDIGPNSSIVMRFDKSWDKKVYEWLNAQKNLQDSLEWLIIKEIYQLGIIDYRDYLVPNRTVDGALNREKYIMLARGIDEDIGEELTVSNDFSNEDVTRELGATTENEQLSDKDSAGNSSTEEESQSNPVGNSSTEEESQSNPVGNSSTEEVKSQSNPVENNSTEEVKPQSNTVENNSTEEEESQSNPDEINIDPEFKSFLDNFVDN